MKNINVIGLMTGTSCDGMDLSLVNCKKNNESIIGKTIKNYYIKYPISLTKKLLKLNTSNPAKIAKANPNTARALYGQFFCLRMIFNIWSFNMFSDPKNIAKDAIISNH